MISEEMGTTLRLKAPSMSLNKNDVVDLCKIVSKAKDDSKSADMRFVVSGTSGVISERQVDKLANVRWPKDIDAIDLEAYGNHTLMRAILESNPAGAHQFIISGSDSDWVSLRWKEIDDFVAEHRNWFWIFHNVAMLFLQYTIFAVLVSLSVTLAFELSFEQSVMIGALTLVAAVASTRGIIEVFPYILIEAGSSSTKTKIRKFLYWAMSTIIAGIIINLIWQVVV